MDGLNDTISTATQNEAPRGPICRELRSKKYFSLTSIPLTDDDILDVSNHCWCRITQQVIGPDGALARPNKCRDGRGCFVSYFENG